MVLGLASASLFSVAQETIAPGNQRSPHQVPLWFSRMASQPYEIAPEVDRFLVPEAARSYYGKVPKYQPMRIVCGAFIDQLGVMQWRYCEI